MAQRPIATGKLLGGLAMLLAGGGCSTWVFVFLLLGCIYTVVFPIAFGLPFDDLRLDRADPVRADGEVLDLVAVPHTSIDEQSVYTLSYHFDVDGERVEDQSRVLEYDALSAASPGSPLEVEYLADAPTVSRPVGARANPGGWAGIIGLPFLLLGVLGLLPVVSVLVGGLWLVFRALRGPGR
jgi:hypothetical protein